MRKYTVKYQGENGEHHTLYFDSWLEAKATARRLLEDDIQSLEIE